MNERLLSDLEWSAPGRAIPPMFVYFPCCSNRIHIFSRILHRENIAHFNCSAFDSQKWTFFGPGSADFLIIVFSPLLFFFIILFSPLLYSFIIHKSY